MQHQQPPDAELLTRLPDSHLQQQQQQQQQFLPHQSSAPESDAGQLQSKHLLEQIHQSAHQSASADQKDGGFARQPVQQQPQTSALMHQDRQVLHPNEQSQHSQESDQHQTTMPLDRQNGFTGEHDGNVALHSCSLKHQQDQLQQQSMHEPNRQSEKVSTPPQTAVAGIAERSGSASVHRQQ